LAAAKHEPRVIWVTQWYRASSERRQAEMAEALARAVQCPAVTDAWVFGASDDLRYLRDELLPEVGFVNARVQYLEHDARLTFEHFLRGVEGFKNGDLCILANSDCAPDDTLALLAAEPLEGVAVCWSRHDVPATGDAGEAVLFAENGVSQDAWALRFPFLDVQAAKYTLGTPGCDNRFAW